MTSFAITIMTSFNMLTEAIMFLFFLASWLLSIFGLSRKHFTIVWLQQCMKTYTKCKCLYDFVYFVLVLYCLYSCGSDLLFKDLLKVPYASKIDILLSKN